MTSQKAQHKKQKTGITTNKSTLSWSQRPHLKHCTGTAEMTLLRGHIPTASMPISRSPDISRHMLLSMSRLHILWYSLKTANGKERFQFHNKRWHWNVLDGFISVALLSWTLQCTHTSLNISRINNVINHCHVIMLLLACLDVSFSLKG